MSVAINAYVLQIFLLDIELLGTIQRLRLMLAPLLPLCRPFVRVCPNSVRPISVIKMHFHLRLENFNCRTLCRKFMQSILLFALRIGAIDDSRRRFECHTHVSNALEATKNVRKNIIYDDFVVTNLFQLQTSPYEHTWRGHIRTKPNKIDKIAICMHETPPYSTPETINWMSVCIICMRCSMRPLTIASILNDFVAAEFLCFTFPEYIYYAIFVVPSIENSPDNHFERITKPPTCHHCNTINPIEHTCASYDAYLSIHLFWFHELRSNRIKLECVPWFLLCGTSIGH